MVKTQMNISVVIPTYNDTLKLGSVLKVVKMSPLVKNVVVVDDGSDNKHATIIKKLCKEQQVTLFIHSKNQGKTAALCTGFSHVTTSYVLFLDADTVGLQLSHISTLFKALQQEKLDVIIGYPQWEPAWIWQKIGFNTILAGSRLIKTSLLKKYPEVFLARGFGFEVRFNQIFFPKTRCKFLELVGVTHIPASKKYGLIQGLWGDAYELFELLSQVYFGEYLRQVWYGWHNRLPKQQYYNTQRNTIPRK